MKNTSKILALVLALVMMFAMASMLTVSAANIPGGTKLYLVPSANWNQSNARFAAYFFGDGEVWVSMTKVEGQTNLYEVTVPEGKNFTNVIFCRMNPSAAANNWNNKWNQTADLVYNGSSNCYTVAEGTWDKGGGTWSTYGSTCLHTNLGPEATCTTPQLCNDCGDPVVSALGHAYTEAHVCTRCGGQATFTVAGSGAHLGTEWDTGNTANDMTYADGVYTKVYTNVAAGTYAFKVARDHDWGTAYPSADKSFKVDTAGSTVTITLTGTTVDVVVVAPHTHVWSDATCTEPKRCECGETEGEALGHDMVTDPAKAPTCTETGLTEGSHCSRCDAATTAQEVVPVIAHSYVEGVCSACGATDPDYVAPQSPAKDVYVNISALENGTTTGEELVAGTGISASAGLTIEGNGKSIDGFKFTTRLKLGGTMKVADGVVTAGIKIVTDGPGKLVVYAISSSSSSTRALRLATLVDGAFVDVAVDENVLGSEIVKCEFDIPAAGTYYLGSKSSGINLYYLAVNHEHTYEATVVAPTCEEEGCTRHACACGHAYEDTKVDALGHDYKDGKCTVCEAKDPNYVPPHVNTLVVGDTNKIIIDAEHGAVDNGAGYPTIAVFFTATEAGHYKFAADGVTIFIYDATGATNLCGFKGEADLEAGTYCIFMAFTAPGTTGECNVAVTKSEIVVPEHVNKLVVGENNKIVVSGETLNQNNNPIEWVTFVVEEKAHYAFTSETENALVFIFDASFNILCGGTGAAVLEPGTYLICVGNGAVGDIYVQVTKTEIPTECEHNWVYMNCTLCGAANPNFAHNLLVVGENKVVCNEYHLVDTTGHGNPYQFTLLTVAEDGLYIFTCDKLIGITIFTTEINDPKADFTAGTGTSWTVYEAGKAELKAGTYYIGFIYVDGVGEYTVNIEKHDEHNHEAVVTDPTCTEAGYTTHTCVCGDTYTDSEVAALGHDYAEGVCSRCEAKDPDYVAPQPPVDEKPDDGEVEEPVQLNFFQKIVKLIKDLLAKFLGFFKRFGL